MNEIVKTLNRYDFDYVLDDNHFSLIYCLNKINMIAFNNDEKRLYIYYHFSYQYRKLSENIFVDYLETKFDIKINEIRIQGY